MHQELIVISDPDSTLGNAAVLNAAPASTAWGLVTRGVNEAQSIVDEATFTQGTNRVNPSGGLFINSYTSLTTGQAGINRLTATGDQFVNVNLLAGNNPDLNSGVKGAGTLRVVLATDQPSLTNALTIAGNSTVVVASGNSSVIVTSGNLTSTCVQGTNPWIIAGNSTVAILSPTSTAAPASNDTGVVVRQVGYSTIVSVANTVTIAGNSTVLQGTTPWTIAGNSTVVILQGNSSVIVTSGNSSVIVTSGNLTSTCVQGTNPWITASVMQSTVAPSSNSSGAIVRQVVDNILTTASTNAMAAYTSFSIQASGAALRSYVTAYSITSTNSAAVKLAFYSSGTMTWPIILQAVSSGMSGVNLATSAPAYIFRTTASEALTLQIKGTTLAGFQVAVAYFRAP